MVTASRVDPDQDPAEAVADLQRIRRGDRFEAGSALELEDGCLLGRPNLPGPARRMRARAPTLRRSSVEALLASSRLRIVPFLTLRAFVAESAHLPPRPAKSVLTGAKSNAPPSTDTMVRSDRFPPFPRERRSPLLLLSVTLLFLRRTACSRPSASGRASGERTSRRHFGSVPHFGQIWPVVPIDPSPPRVQTRHHLGEMGDFKCLADVHTRASGYGRSRGRGAADGRLHRDRGG